MLLLGISRPCKVTRPHSPGRVPHVLHRQDRGGALLCSVDHQHRPVMLCCSSIQYGSPGAPRSGGVGWIGPPSHRRAPSPNPTSPATTSSAINRSALFLLDCDSTVSIVRDLKGPEPYNRTLAPTRP